MLNQSSYNHTLETHNGHKFIIIVDLFNTTPGDNIKTVIHNIENVVDDICTHERILAKDYFVIYRDTDDLWSAWDHLTLSFIPGILEKDERVAVNKILEKIKS